METKANYLMIGGFVLGVFALAFIFIYWMSNFGGGGQRYTIVFQSSVAGLTTGSSVGFNGIRVGEVQSFSLDPEDARKVNVLISVRDDTPVRENSHASIQSMGLTGGSGIQITPGTPDSPLLVATDENPAPIIRADPGSGQGMFEAGADALNNANVFISKLNALLDQNEKSINMMMSNV
jgi:phospholipid/cholesterol/gamma-HCH transport system substrate-binding protein